MAAETQAGPFAALWKPSEPESKKGAVRKLFEKITGAGDTAETMRNHAEVVGRSMRQYTESAVIGGALGALHAQDPFGGGVGLDYVVKKATGATAAVPATATTAAVAAKPASAAKTIPLDGALAAAGLLGALFTSGSGVNGVSDDFGNVGAAALSVFTFRKAADIVAAKKRAAKAPAGGTVPSLVSLQREANAAAGIHGEMHAANANFGADSLVHRAAMALGQG
jgi:hypothetical protein